VRGSLRVGQHRLEKRAQSGNEFRRKHAGFDKHHRASYKAQRLGLGAGRRSKEDFVLLPRGTKPTLVASAADAFEGICLERKPELLVPEPLFLAKEQEGPLAFPADPSCVEVVCHRDRRCTLLRHIGCDRRVRDPNTRRRVPVPVELPAITLPPHGAAAVDLTALMDDARIREDLAHVSVRIVNNGAPGSLIGGVSALSRDRMRAYDLPLREAGPSSHATGSYPWRIDGDTNTVVSLTNLSDRPAKYHARIVYPSGVYWLREGEVAWSARLRVPMGFKHR
jgi:hypothetical protein